MDQTHVKYLLAGGGLASGSAAEAIRARDPVGSMMLVGQEINRPYHRPPLSKQYLRRQISRSELMVEPLGWFDQNKVELRTGRRVAQLDTARHTATLDNGEEVNFDTMLIATGAAPRPLSVPGADLPNVYMMRTIEDVDRVHHAIDQAKHEGQRHDAGRGRVAVIGAGALGVEVAASLTQCGLSVDLIVRGGWPWHKYAGEGAGKFLARYFEIHGIKVHTKAILEKLEGDGRVQRIVLADGQSISCDFVLGAVGMVVNREILRGTPIDAERAILVDSHCRTNIDGIFAAGDCAAVFDPLFGKHRVMDHWDNAKLTGQIAGTNMAGGDAGYDAVSHFSSAVFDLSLSAWGESRVVHHRLLRGSTVVDQPDFIEIGLAADGRVAQVLGVNHTGEDKLLEYLVKRRADLTGLEESVKDPSWNLAEVLENHS
jgi:3-phenylpropionate/trans-cinnamate dioxygenase ferredoxin reductase subunit